MPLEPRSKDDVQRAAFGLRRGNVSLGQERLCSAEGRARAGLDLLVAASIGPPSPEYSQSVDQ